MKKLASVFCCILVVVLAVPSNLLAQNLVDEGRGWISSTVVRPGADMIVEMKSGETIKGKFEGVTQGSISLSRNGKTTDFEKDKIATVWRVGRSLKKPAIVGAAVGAGAGAIIGIAAGGCSPGDFICFDRKATIPAAAAVLGIVGLGIGMIVGSVHHHKVVVYQASQ